MIENKYTSKKDQSNEKAVCGIKKDIKASFKTKRNKQGAFMTLSTTILVVIILVLNLVVGRLDIKLDLTKDKLYTLSEQTKSILNNLTDDIFITVLCEEDKQSKGVTEILQKYRDTNKKITVEYIDPLVNPALVKEYAEDGQTLANGSIVIKYGNKFKVINNEDMYEYDNTNGTVVGVKVEQQVTSAIQYVTNENLPIAFTLTGHNEAELSDFIKEELSNDNYTLSELSLVSGEWKYKSSDLIIINSPQRDLSIEEFEAISEFLNNGGGALFIMDYLPKELNNFTSLLNNYGLSLTSGIVIEGDSAGIYRAATNILPFVGTHEITTPLVEAKLPILVQSSQGVEISDLTRESLNITPLLCTSELAYSKLTNDFKTLEKEDGDISGVFNLAVAVSDNLDNKEAGQAKIVVIGTKEMLSDSSINLTNGGNLDFVMNSISWLSEREDNISIRAKNISSEQITINQNLVYSVAMVTMVALPLIVGIVGVVVWFKRRHL